MKRPSTLLLALALLAAGCQSTDQRAVVSDLLRRGEFGDAIREAERLREDVGDAWADERIEEAKLGIRLARGRELLFDGELEEALLIFQEAHRVAPEVEATERWLGKCEQEIARSLLDQALLQVDRDDIAGANASYERALTFDPDSEFALNGLARTQRSLEYRSAQSAEYYRDGLRSFRDFALDEARRELSIATKYDPTNVKAEERRELVDQSLVEFHLARARGLAEDDLWPAAQLELRRAEMYGPDDPEVQAEVARVDAEVGAIRLINEARIKLRRSDFAGAEEALARATELAEHQADRLSLARAEIEEGRYEASYQDALGLERDYRHEEALAAFEALLGEAEFYKDAIARRNTLREFLDQAATLYEQAATKNGDEALSLYRQIDVLLPEYRDVPARIRALSESASAAR